MTAPARVAEGVPFMDFSAVHPPLKGAILEDVGRLIDSGAFVNGPQVGEFEEQFRAYCGVEECVGVASGLDALRLALLAAGVEPGDEVILPANTFAATIEAVLQAQAAPVLVDVTTDDYNIDVEAAGAAVTGRTRFILPVHLYGQLADMKNLGDVARRSGVGIIEDACQAHGAERDGVRPGSVSTAAAFSFYPAKNLGAFGDAGALVTDDAAVASRARALREHGQVRKYSHDFAGYTARLDSLQAIVLKHKLPLLDGWNSERRAARDFYDAALRDVGDLVLPPQPGGSAPVWHLYVVRTRDPEALASYLGERQIATGRHYPEPIHLSPAFLDLGYPAGSFPVTETLASELISLPIFPGMSEEQLTRVAEAVRSFFTDA